MKGLGYAGLVALLLGCASSSSGGGGTGGATNAAGNSGNAAGNATGGQANGSSGANNAGGSDADAGEPGNAGGTQNQAGSNNAGTCADLGFECGEDGDCCDGASCVAGFCCNRAGGSCRDSADCCFFAACTDGMCECSKSIPFAEGCTQNSDCCVDSPDHQECVPEEAPSTDSYCGFTGTMQIDGMDCSIVGMSGININEYCVTVTGSLTGPVGASLDFFTDPQFTINSECPQQPGCNAWEGQDLGLCTRRATDPEATQFTMTYRFGSDMTSGLSVMPELELVSPNGSLAQQIPTITCQMP
jgi:hypothetical protein